MRAIALLAALLMLSAAPLVADPGDRAEQLQEVLRLRSEQPEAALDLLDQVLGPDDPDPGAETDPENLAGLYRLRIMLLRSQGNYALAMTDAERLGLLAQWLGNVRLEAQALLMRGTIEAEQGHYGIAMEQFHSARQLLEGTDHLEQLAVVYNAIGMTHNFADDRVRARDYFELALATARRVADDFLIATYKANVANVLAAIEGPDAALPMQRKVLAMGERLGDVSIRILALANICDLLVDSGDLDEADRACPHAMAEIDSFGGSRLRAGIRLAVGKLRSAQDRPDEALNVYQDGLEIARGVVPTVHRELLVLLAEMHDRMGQPGAAVDRYRELILLRDENLERDRQAMVEELEVRYQVDRSAAELQLLRLDADLQATRIRLRNALLIALAIVLIITSAAAVVALRAHRLQSRLREQLAARNDELEQAVTRISKLARRDPLTGLLNRRALEEMADQELARKRRYGTPLSLLIADIDHFKLINDRHGHAVGDEILEGLGRRLRESFRTSDLIARWGGEEFLCLLPDTSLESAAAAIERLRANLKEHPLETGVGPLHIRLTFGLVEVENELHAAILRADQAMYEGKAAGRDRLVSRPNPAQELHG